MADPRWPIGEAIEIIDQYGNNDTMGWITKRSRTKWEARHDPDQEMPLPVFRTLKAAIGDLQHHFYVGSSY